MSPALLRELSDLRRLAYGPDDGAAMDREALRRLAELEALLHPSVEPAATPAPTVIDLPPLPPAAQRPAQTRGLHPQRRRTLDGFATAVAVASVVLVSGVALVATAPHGEALLVATPATGLERQQLVDAVDLESFGLVGARLQQYEDFRGLSVWSAATARGVTCLLVGTSAGRPMGASCTPAPLHPTYDYSVTADTPSQTAAQLPPGSVIRFVWDDTSVGVWVAVNAAG